MHPAADGVNEVHLPYTVIPIGNSCEASINPPVPSTDVAVLSLCAAATELNVVEES